MLFVTFLRSFNFYKIVCPHFPFVQHLETAVIAYFFYAYYRVSKFKFVDTMKVLRVGQLLFRRTFTFKMP